MKKLRVRAAGPYGRAKVKINKNAAFPGCKTFGLILAHAIKQPIKQGGLQ